MEICINVTNIERKQVIGIHGGVSIDLDLIILICFTNDLTKSMHSLGNYLIGLGERSSNNSRSLPLNEELSHAEQLGMRKVVSNKTGRGSIIGWGSKRSSKQGREDHI